MEVLYANIIKIVVFEPNKKAKATSETLTTARQSWPLYFLHSHPDNMTSIYLGKRVMENVLKEIKETDTLCAGTKMEYEAGQTHFLKNADNPIDQSGIISGVRSAQSYFQKCVYHHQFPSHVHQMSSLNPQMFPGTLKANMWHQLLAGFPLMAQDGLKKVFSICFPCAPSWIHRGVQ